MEIILKPSCLKFDQENTCSCCKNTVQQEQKRDTFLIEECHDCRYKDRPFGHNNQNLVCSCVYGIKDVMYIICQYCERPQCKNPKCNMIFRCENKNCNYNFCNTCIQSNLYNIKWNQLNSKGKILYYYKFTELKTIAKERGINGYSKMNKQHLINILSES